MRAAWQRIKVQGIVCLHYNPKGCKICVPESVLNGEVDQTASAKKARTAKGNLKLLQFWLKADEVKHLVLSVSGKYHNGTIVGIVEQDRKKKLAKDLYFVFVIKVNRNLGNIPDADHVDMSPTLPTTSSQVQAESDAAWPNNEGSSQETTLMKQAKLVSHLFGHAVSDAVHLVVAISNNLII